MSTGGLLLELVAIVGGTVHTMEPGAEPRVADVLVRDGRIEAVGPDLEPPPGARRIDASGLHVVPGLVDGFVHFDPDHDALYVAAGVTTVCDWGGDPTTLFQLRQPAARERVPGPALLVSGPPIEGRPRVSPHSMSLGSEADAEHLVASLLERRIDFVAFHGSLSEEPWRALLASAHRAGLRVFGPRPRDVPLGEVLAAGQDGLYSLSSLLPEDVAWEFVQPAGLAPAVEAVSAAERLAAVVPALAGAELRLVHPMVDARLRALALAAADLGREPRPDAFAAWTRGLVDEKYRRAWEDDARARAADLRSSQARSLGRALEKQRGLLRELDREGVRLVPGSGAPGPWLVPGRSLVLELESWVRAGVAPERALAFATREAAFAFGLGEDRGRVAPGLVADLVLLDGDPTADVRALRSPRAVVVRGRPLERSDLDRLLAGTRAELVARAETEREPLEIERPRGPVGEVLLSGQVERRVYGAGWSGQRVAGERWMAVRTPEGDLAFCGRIHIPREGVIAAREIEVVQSVRDGRLVAFEVRFAQAGRELVARGRQLVGGTTVEHLVDGERDRIERLGRPIDAIDVGSVTTLLVLARSRTRGDKSALAFGPELTTLVGTWTLDWNEEGRHGILHRVPEAQSFFELGAEGGLAFHVQKVGPQTYETRPVAFESHGPGLPLLESKLSGASPAAASAASREGEAGR